MTQTASASLTTAPAPWPSTPAASASRRPARPSDSWTDAVLLYGRTEDGSLTPYLDRATVVGREFRPVSELDSAELEQMTALVVRISLHISYRIGDFIVFEQDPPVPLGRGGRLGNIDIL